MISCSHSIIHSFIYPSIHFQIWGVNVGCTGRKAGETVITIDLILNRVDVNKLSNTTSLSFKRKKVCQLFEVAATAEEASADVPAYVIFFAAVGGCLFFLILLFVTGKLDLIIFL